jgi:hypothetical protein
MQKHVQARTKSTKIRQMNHHFHPTAVAALPCRQGTSTAAATLGVLFRAVDHTHATVNSNMCDEFTPWQLSPAVPTSSSCPHRSMPHQYVIATNQLFGRQCRQSHRCAIPPQIANGGRDFCQWTFIGPPKAVLWSPPNRQFILLVVWYSINQCFKKCLGEAGVLCSFCRLNHQDRGMSIIILPM